MEGYEVMPAAEAARFADDVGDRDRQLQGGGRPGVQGEDEAPSCATPATDSRINLEWLEDHATKKGDQAAGGRVHAGRPAYGDRAGAGAS